MEKYDMGRFTYPILQVERIIDGDTLKVVVDLGFNTRKRVTVRLAGLDTPEIRGANKVLGKKVTRHVRNWIDYDTEFLMLKSLKWDGFGRSIGEIYDEDDGRNLNAFLLANKLARKYAPGISKKPWSKAALKRIADYTGHKK